MRFFFLRILDRGQWQQDGCPRQQPGGQKERGSQQNREQSRTGLRANSALSVLWFELETGGLHQCKSASRQLGGVARERVADLQGRKRLRKITNQLSFVQPENGRLAPVFQKRGT